MDNMGFISIVPIIMAISLALYTKDTVISLVVACIAGCFIAGKGIWGFSDLLQKALGNGDFIWVALNILFFGLLVTFYQKSGAIDGFTKLMQKYSLKRSGAQVTAWFLGIFCFADSMSPLFVGSVMRNFSDKMKISREKLAYIADSTAAPVSILYPFTGWSAYLAGLAVGFGCLQNREQAFSLMLSAIPFNFYAILSLLMVLFIALGVIKDFGPMNKAENRAMFENKLVRDGARPLAPIKEIKKAKIKERVFLNFILPTILLLVIAIGGFVIIGSVKSLEAVIIVVVLMSVSFLLQGMSLIELSETITEGIKETIPSLMVLAVAYPLNVLSNEMGAANFIINSTSEYLTPVLLPCGIFMICSILSFATGTSWETFAIAIPLALPMAFNVTGNELTLFVVLCFAAVAGGGLFGDHCSPVSDTTIMASMGAGSDHIDHVETQLPYAITVGIVTAILYLVLGYFAV